MLDSCPPLPSAQLRLPTVAASAARYFVLAADNFGECLIQCPAADRTLVAFGRSAGKSQSTPPSLRGCAGSALFSLVEDEGIAIYAAERVANSFCNKGGGV